MNFTAINWFSRFYYLLCLLVVYFVNLPILYFYISFFILSIEVLLLNKSKSETKVFKISQLVFVLFISYVLFVRSFKGFSTEINYNLNTVEHLFFAVVICLLIYFYFIFYYKKRLKYPLLLSGLVFNFIGLINESFQNYFNGKPIFILDTLSVKDIVANVFGTLIFITVVKFLTVRMLFLNSIEK